MYGFKTSKTSVTTVTQYQPVLVNFENVDFNTNNFMQINGSGTEFQCTQGGIYNISFNVQTEQDFLQGKSVAEVGLRINGNTVDVCIMSYRVNDTITYVGSTTEKLSPGDKFVVRYIPPRNVTSYNIKIYPGSFLAMGGGAEA